MADPEAVVPYYDPYESPLNHNILNFANDQNPTLADLSQPTLQGPFPYTSSLPEINETTPGDNHPFSDPMVHGAFQSNNGGGSTEAGPSNVHAESSHQGQENFGSQNFGEDGIPLSIWPEPPIPFFCSCCQVLRQLVHTNGSIIAKLEIHGRLGMICHAILEERNVNVGSSNHHQIKMFDFCGKSLEDIKYFLMQYCLRQNLAGFAMMEDPLSSYYETLCIGLDWDDDLNDFHQFSPNNSGEASEMEQEAEAENGEERPRVNLSVQRERVVRLTLNELSNYFHLPIHEAARHLNLCITVVKKICRREGLVRWPYRKVRGHTRQIQILRASLNTASPLEKERAKSEIERLQLELFHACHGLLPTAIDF